MPGERIIAGRIVVAGIVAVTVAGCTSPPPPLELWRAERSLAYCYRTLADADCTPTPTPGAEHRLIAVAPAITFTPIPPDQLGR